MPWRLISFIIVLILLMFFIGFNLDNRSDISLMVHTFEDIPIFFSMFASFLIGVVLMLPFALGKKKIPRVKKENKTSRLSFRGKKKSKGQEKNENQNSLLTQDEESQTNA